MAEIPLLKGLVLFRRIVLVIIVQRLPGRERVPEIGEFASSLALEAARSAVGARAHQDEVSAVVEPERRAIHAGDSQVPVRVDLLWDNLTPG
jgi:hypothetical protein